MSIYMPSHPLYAAHAIKFNPDDLKTVPNFIGPPLPQRDQGDREYYCSTMLTFFKPWCTGNDLKASILHGIKNSINTNSLFNKISLCRILI